MLLASYYFYASNSQWLLILIILSTSIDYLCALGITDTDNQRKRKLWLLLSLVSNLSILGFFKYFNFFAQSVTELVGLIGFTLSWVDINIILPVGISFFTFQSMSYTIDVYRKEMPAERSFYRFAFFVAYFPQLIAGPIVRAKEFIPQIALKPKLSINDFEWSLFMIFRGLFKKIILADALALYADLAFSTPGQIDWMAAWIGVYAFTFQIYFDFSGYTDIARGCAKLMGYNLPLNFDSPYVATSITDFWRRWHISLSTWLRDYLYISLGGNKMKNQLGVYRNLMITMLLGGLWHGAAWNFVIWGFLHGLFLSLERLLRIGRFKNQNKKDIPLMLFRRLFYFHLIVMTWIVFRVDNMDDLFILVHKLFEIGKPYILINGYVVVIGISVGNWLLQIISERLSIYRKPYELPVLLKGSVYAIVAIMIMIFNSGEPTPFIYFQF